ncbi:hypothetical protein [Leeia oryzae]|uniref:hypothetical protein n=1 Tax=Leeia oryzae TaxID=356662 RepID=UPI0003651267|nr:hypothetical protein [Leeia oryzae]
MENPYQQTPPAPARPYSTSQPPYFAVSTFKLMVMSLATLGFYELFWFLKHWQRVKERERSAIWIIPRSLFAVLFSYALFRRIATSQKERQLAPSLAAAFWALCLFMFNAAMFLPGNWSLLNFLSLVPLLVTQAAANQVNKHDVPDHDPNSTFSPLNKLVLWIGLAVWFNILAGLIQAN